MITAKIIKNSVIVNKFLVIFITLSIAASVFCSNVALGYAESQYRAVRSSNTYATLAFANINEKNIPQLEYIEDNYGYDIGSALYITKTAEKTYVIGWNGYDTALNWFPHMSGRFFNEKEYEQAENVVYISENIYTSLNGENKIALGGTTFDMIGYGWIIGHNFSSMIDSSSPQKVFDLNVSGSDCKFYILPYNTYVKEGYNTELILMRFNGLSRAELEKACSIIQKDFSEYAVTLSPKNSDEVLVENKSSSAFIGGILLLIVWLGMINLVWEWLGATKQIAYVYMCCGLSKNRMKFAVVSEIFLLFAVGGIIAVIVQLLLKDLLATLGAGYMPRAGEVVIAVLLSFLITLLASIGKLKGMFETKRTVE